MSLVSGTPDYRTRSVILRSGSRFTYGETKLGQGRQNVKAYLAEHPEIAAAIEPRSARQWDSTAGPDRPAQAWTRLGCDRGEQAKRRERSVIASARTTIERVDQCVAFEQWELSRGVPSG